MQGCVASLLSLRLVSSAGCHCAKALARRGRAFVARPAAATLPGPRLDIQAHNRRLARPRRSACQRGLVRGWGAGVHAFRFVTVKLWTTDPV